MSTKSSHQQDVAGTAETTQLTLALEETEPETECSEIPPATGEKLHGLIQKYELTDLADDLERQYTPPGPCATLRDLSQKVNETILDLNTRSARISEAEYDECLDLLRADDRELTEDKLDRLGVDGEKVLTEMISHGTVQNYLRTYRDVEKRGRRYNTPEESAATISGYQNGIEKYLRSRVAAHSERGEIAGEPDVEVTVNLRCHTCGNSVNAVKYFELTQCPRCL